MIGETVDIIGTAILFLAPFVLALIVIVLLIAYPWLLLIPLGIWYLVVKYGQDEVASGDETTESLASSRIETCMPDSGTSRPSSWNWIAFTSKACHGRASEGRASTRTSTVHMSS